jgi:hypothetical protein
LYSATINSAIQNGGVSLSAGNEKEYESLKNLGFILKTNKLPIKLRNLSIQITNQKNE